ncbi:MAG TPA: PDDEXK nuclease domain-containing protein [Candidatus Goldiibacteriota bacterium]|nr:PDDEXK nuclease domain-containing protein [Candidatus Goldiibacteriota bacterium]HPN64299.1 PDDEXK nuclease domain-containing protein [Candidatus Goldiibacteriota bacterium]HRQ43130.1 PDDEXK nuclease domain-containing protein [Candidatus Goldiibacteriota bacterium]
MKPVKGNINRLYGSIRQILENARTKAYRAVNSVMVMAYWEIGREIVEEEQKGNKRAGYGEGIIRSIAERLTAEYGEGFNKTNIWYMKQFYLSFENLHALRGELSWTHYRQLLKVENINARMFYMNECVNSNWSTRELDRQINSLLYERLALSKNKKKIRQLSEKGQIIKSADDMVKDPYVLEFLGMKENKDYLEKDIEKTLIKKLRQFILELGRGFSFVERQKRITIDGDHYYVDLVFYNYILKCFVLIDLKVGKLTHQDIGQMDFYVRYFEDKIRPKADNPTIGIVMCSEKNEAMVKYTMLKDSKQVFASKYKLYLPKEKELRDEIVRERRLIEGKSSK